MGRQVVELRRGQLADWADKIHQAGINFINQFADHYGDEGRRALSSTYRMAKMEEESKPVWARPWR